ncbi:hypothetical protein C7R94_19065 [Brevibacillus sp. NRRL NRS-603]|nr:hypothetical protein C7R94_19065 [Brevibacillus sp. NRRL NRS-603]
MTSFSRHFRKSFREGFFSQHSGGEEKAQFSSTLTRPQGGFTGRLHLKKGTVEPKPPYGRTFLKEEVFDKRGPLF